MKKLFIILALLWCVPVWAAEVIPPKPDKYFTDNAHVTSQATADRLNSELENFERQTSSQIVVAMYPKMQSESDIAEYAVRVYRAWKIGQQDKNNGALLLIFVDDHKMNITTGYGLEGALPDAICKDIISDQIAPHFKRGDFDGGVSAGVASMIAAAKGEYKGRGTTVYEQRNGRAVIRNNNEWLLIGFGIFFFFVIILPMLTRSRRNRGWYYSGGGFGPWWGGWSGGGWSGGGGGGWSGGGGGGGGFGGFSGGGGSSGGGGASGSW